MKKITVALFVSLTLVLGAAACGDDDETTAGAESDDRPATHSTAPPRPKTPRRSP